MNETSSICFPLLDSVQHHSPLQGVHFIAAGLQIKTVSSVAHMVTENLCILHYA